MCQRTPQSISKFKGENRERYIDKYGDCVHLAVFIHKYKFCQQLSKFQLEADCTNKSQFKTDQGAN